MIATIHLAPKLWALCDVLRDDGITYHQYINELSYLLFLKLSAETGTEKSLPKHCTWGTLLQTNGADEQYRTYKKILVDLGNQDRGVIKDIFANPTTMIRRARTLTALVRGIDELDWHDTSRESFGDVYEELLEYSAEKRSGAGQYFTPRPLVESIVHVLQPKPGEVIQDPALGTAGFLVSAHQYVRQVHGANLGAKYVGIELVPENYRIALMNTFIHGMGGSYAIEDTLSPYGASLPAADLVLTNPPFGSSRGAGGPTRTDLPFRTSNKQLAFIQHIVGTLKPGGRAGVVVPDNVLFEGAVGKQVRTELMSKCNLHTILRLPTGIFYAPGVKTNVLFFTRGIEPRNNTRDVWVFDMRTGMPQFGRRTALSRKHFRDFEAAYGSDPWCGQTSLAQREDLGDGGRFRKFSRQWILDRGENLDITWLRDEGGPSETETEPVVLVRETINELQGALEELGELMVELGAESEQEAR